MLAASIICIIAVNSVCLTMMVKDLYSYGRKLWQEPGSTLWQAFLSLGMYFLSAFGISDFVISTVVYSKTGWVEPRKLPATLNTQCVVPLLVGALVYVGTVEVEIVTLISCMATFTVGSYIAPYLALRLPLRRIRQLLCLGLILAGSSIIINKLGLLDIGGESYGLSGMRLVVFALCFFFIGLLKALGISSYPLSMAAVFFFGLHPMVSYPLMMGCGALGTPVATMRYIRSGAYMRKLTLLGMSCGLLGTVAALFIVKSLNTSLLQWLVVIVVLYASVDMLMLLHKERREDRLK